MINFDDLLTSTINDGINVEWVRMAPGYCGAVDLRERTIYLAHDLDSRPRHAISTLAHELGHLHLLHGCTQGTTGEREADLYAARLLITPVEYALAEQLHGTSTTNIADELGVTRWAVDAYRAWLATRPV